MGEQKPHEFRLQRERKSVGVLIIIPFLSSFAFFQVFERYLTFCGIGIQNAQLFEVSILEYKKNQVSEPPRKFNFPVRGALPVYKSLPRIPRT